MQQKRDGGKSTFFWPFQSFVPGPTKPFSQSQPHSRAESKVCINMQTIETREFTTSPLHIAYLATIFQGTLLTSN